MNRIEREKKTIGQMVSLYCRRKEHNRELCIDCTGLLVYAHKRLDVCKFGNAKPACQKCPVHCYSPARRIQISTVMRYAGPRMLLCYPLAAIRHLLNM